MSFFKSRRSLRKNRRTTSFRPQNEAQRRLRFEPLEERSLLAVITVNSLADTVVNDSQVTLREAIIAANTDTSVDGSTAGNGPDTIIFASGLAGGTINLSTIGDNSFGSSALFINSDITITGSSTSGITIARSNSAANMRLFYVNQFGRLNLQNATISNGRNVAGAGGSPGGGGGAGLGGAIYNMGTVALNNSTITNNVVIGGAGGGLGFTSANIPGQNGGNGGYGGGGGGGGFGTSGGNGGTGGFGGGVGGGGGGTNGSPGLGGTSVYGGGNGGNGTINQTAGGGGGAGLGGAIFNEGGNVQVTNSTFSGNQAIGGSGGGGGATAGLSLGGGIFNRAGTITVINSTFSGNTANSGGGGIFNLGDGFNAVANITNTILANSANGASDFNSNTINGGNSVTTGSNNLVETNNGYNGGVVSIADPRLGNLVDNGGPTFTFALQAGSPALNAGTNTGAPIIDQRLFPRPSSGVGVVDIGAYEDQAPTLTVNNATVTVNGGATATNSGTFSDLDPNDNVTVTASVGAIVPATSGRNGNWNWTYSTTNTTPSQTVTITATDSAGVSTTTTFNLVVNSTAPIVAITGPTTASAGQTNRYNFTTTQSGVNTYTIQSIAGGSVGTVSNVVFSTLTGAGSFDVTFGAGPAMSLVSVQVRDQNNVLSNTASINVAVSGGGTGGQNTAPTVTVNNASVAVNEGSIASNTGSFVDLNVGDNVTITASIGTISPPTSGTNGTWSWSYAPNDGPDQSQTVTITARDSGNLTSTKTFQLVVNNVAPTVLLSGPNSATVGQTQQYTFTTSDPGVDTFTLMAVAGGGAGTLSNVQFNNTTGVGSFNVTFSGGLATSTVSVRVADSDGALSNQATIPVTITGGSPQNSAPAVSVNNATVTVNEGSVATNTGLFSDVDVGDNVIVTASIGTISPPTTGNNGTWTWSYPTTDGPDQSQTVVITAKDSSNATNTISFTLTVANVSPTVTLNGPTSANVGELKQYTFQTSDPGLEAFTLSATSGGSVGTVSNIVFNQLTGTGSFDVTFNAGPATSVVTVRVADSDGALSNLATVNVAVAVSGSSSPWQNTNNTLDVSNDSFVSPIDVLFVINELNSPQYSGTGGALPATPPTGTFPFLDVNGDGFVSPVDALGVINYLNLRNSGQEGGEGEGGTYSEVSAITSSSSQQAALDTIFANLDQVPSAEINSQPDLTPVLISLATKEECVAAVKSSVAKRDTQSLDDFFASLP